MIQRWQIRCIKASGVARMLVITMAYGFTCALQGTFVVTYTFQALVGQLGLNILWMNFKG
jgi:hypothetical protein